MKLSSSKGVLLAPRLGPDMVVPSLDSENR